MGIIRKGALGGFSGKAGSIIGSSWNDLDYIKGLYKKSTKPATEKQIEQRLKFALVVAFLSPIKDVLNMGYKGQTNNKATGYNMGVQFALANAITGTSPDFALDHSMLQISKGTLLRPIGVTVTSTAAATLTVSWNPQLNELNGFTDDRLVLLVYNMAQDYFSIKSDFALRGDGTADYVLPADFTGQDVEVYMFYIDRDNIRRSKSTYAGPIVVA
ncbi:DUF6266 family protein [Pedobacter sp. BMA]|uniref:DUF6266 family protein n=1 Tax=Pedobacter sp. BMA TaxID=1663685 RepID=UPI0006492E7E|nr:DUF6266 family protein [Pedobacter sp. BMA]KLT64724.1 hypothetical protein AB669_13315 [Pedobacter sp. BMA]